MVIQQKVSKRTWEKEFSSGEWEGLDSAPSERARHAIIGMFLNYFCPDGKILDVGCGLGTTTDFLNPAQSSKYLGIDISETAVSEAVRRKKMNFRSIDFLEFPVHEKFNVIIFNEVLYYLDEEAAVKHSLNLLEEDGFIIVSLYRQKNMHYNDKSIWRICRKYFNPIDNVEINSIIIDGRLISWRIEILRKKESFIEEKLKHKEKIGKVHFDTNVFKKFLTSIYKKFTKVKIKRKTTQDITSDWDRKY